MFTVQTGHKRLHEEQSKKLAENQVSSHMKDEFFAVMSHELKHPLNLIQLNTEILRRLPSVRSAEKASKAVSTISDAVASQARIIDDLLDVARIRTGKLKLTTQLLDLANIVRDIHAVAVEEYPGAEITLDAPSADASVPIEGDPTRLEQIIWNLLHNALKFTQQDARIQMILGAYDGHARLQIIDNGIGLAPTDIEHVFDLFSQAKPKKTNHQRDGLGIGLSLVRQLVQAHGGSVSVKSAGLGHGCAFTVLLPLSDQTIDNDQTAPRSEQKGRLKGLKVLLVDDSPEVIDVMRMLLEMEDALVKSSSEPLQALHNATDEHIILSDIGMPQMDGHELIQALRQTKLHKFAPAIALTGYGIAAEVQKARSSGFDRHLSKPVQYEELVEVIEELCSSMLK